MLIKGGIYRGKQELRRKNVYHPVVCLEDDNDTKDSFEACVLTHSTKGKNYENNPMEKKHFLESDEKGNLYPFKYENTCIVRQVFEKQVFWIEDTCIGKLSEEGLEFVLQHKDEFGPSIRNEKRLRDK